MSAWERFLLQEPSRLDSHVKAGASLEDLLQDPDILTGFSTAGSEIQMQFRLYPTFYGISFYIHLFYLSLCKVENVHQLLLLLFTQASLEQPTDSDYRTSYIISQILCSSVKSLRASLISKPCILLLFSFIESSAPRTPLFCRYVSDIFQSLLGTYASEIIELFRERNTAKHMVSHFENISMCTLFTNIIMSVRTYKGDDALLPV